MRGDRSFADRCTDPRCLVANYCWSLVHTVTIKAHAKAASRLRQDAEQVRTACKINQSARKEQPGKADASDLAGGQHTIVFVPHIRSAVLRAVAQRQSNTTHPEK